MQNIWKQLLTRHAPFTRLIQTLPPLADNNIRSAHSQTSVLSQLPLGCEHGTTWAVVQFVGQSHTLPPPGAPTFRARGLSSPPFAPGSFSRQFLRCSRFGCPHGFHGFRVSLPCSRILDTRHCYIWGVLHVPFATHALAALGWQCTQTAPRAHENQGHFHRWTSATLRGCCGCRFWRLNAL